MPNSRHTELANTRLALPENTTMLSVVTAATFTTHCQIVLQPTAMRPRSAADEGHRAALHNRRVPTDPSADWLGR